LLAVTLVPGELLADCLGAVCHDLTLGRCEEKLALAKAFFVARRYRDWR